MEVIHEYIGAVDNFDILTPVLNCVSDDEFYFLQIIRRKKENPEDTRHMTLIKDIYLNKYRTLETEGSLIKTYCHMFNARAYLRMNKRTYSKVGHMMDSIVMRDYSANNQYKAMASAFSSAAGLYHSQKPAIWLIDFDNDVEYDMDEVIKRVVSLQTENKKQRGEIVLSEPLVVPTLNGSHILTHPFNTKMFNSEFPQCKITKGNKDNPTLLYSPIK